MTANKPGIRAIALIADEAGAAMFRGDNGRESRGWAVYVGNQLAERYGRQPSKVFARLMVLWREVIPVTGCRCDVCR